MAVDKTITVGGKADPSLDKLVKTSKILNQELDKAEKPRVVKSATRTGSRAADAALGVSGGGLDAGLMRGSSGAGGRGGERDFARQAQGLGGLVHIYATFAANIYAVSAAFTALQKAADTTNMIKAANELSSVYGVSLGNVAKNLRGITDGALSMKEALGFANLGGAAGLSTKQMGDLAKVAAGASQALGRDLSDALNRIYKGTIKIEPELLDELGIMVKVDEANKAYARTLGKTVLQLTDYERRQAFAIAVTEQGIKKYGELAQINPYSKLLASLQDLSSESLSVINTVISPLVKFLGESPTGLAAAIGLVVGKLAKMAMPDLLAGLSTRVEGASKALETASANYKQANIDVAKAFEKTIDFATMTSGSKSKFLKEAAKLRKEFNDSLLTDIEMGGKGPVKYSSETKNLLAQYESTLKNYVTSFNNAPGLVTPKIAGYIADANKQLDIIKAAKIDFATLADEESITASARNKENRATLDILKAQRAHRVAELVMDGQHVAALKTSYTLQAGITQEKLKQLGLENKLAMRVGGAIGGIIGSTGTALMSFANVLPMLTMVIGGLALLGSGLKYVGKEFGLITDYAEKASNSTDTLKESINNLDSAYNKLVKAKSLDQIFDLKLSTVKLMAEAAESLAAAYNEIRNLETKGTSLDKLLDKIPFLGGAGSKFNQELARTLAKNAKVSGFDTTNLREQMIKDMPAAFKGDQASLEKSLRNMPMEDLAKTYLLTAKSEEDLAKRRALLVKINDELSYGAASVASRLTTVRDNMSELGKLTKDFTNSLIPNIPAIKGVNRLLGAMTSSLQEPEAAIKFVQGFTAELGVLTNTEIPPAITEFTKKLVEIEAVAKQAGISEEEQAKYIKQKSEALVKDNNIMAIAVQTTFNMANSAVAMATAVSNADLQIAKFNKSLKDLSVREGVFGPSKTSEASKIGIEQAIAKEEANKLKAQAEQAQQILNITAGQMAAALGRTSIGNLTTIGGLAEASSQIGSEKDIQKLIQLGNLYKALSENIVSNTVAQNAYSIAQLKSLSATEIMARLNQASAAEQKQANESVLKTTEEALLRYQTQADILNVLIPNYKELTAATEEQLKYTRDLAALEVQVADARNKVKARESLVPRTEAEKASLEQARNELTAAEANMKQLLDNKGLRSDAAILRQLAAEDKQRIEYLTKGQEAINSLLNIAQTSTASRNKLLQDSIKLSSEELAINIRAKDLEITKQREAITGLKNNKADSRTILLAENQLGKLQLDNLAMQAKYAEIIYNTKVKALEVSMQDFELSGRGGVGQYFKNIATNFGVQLSEAIASAKPAASLLTEGIISGIDASIDKLMEGIQQGNLNIQDLTNFARNALSDAFRDAAAQSLKTGWKDIMASFMPKLSETPELALKTALESNTMATEANTSILGGGTSTIGSKSSGTTLADDAITKTEDAAKTQEGAAKESSNAGKTFLKASDTMFLAGAAMMAFQGKWEQVAFMFLAQLATTLSTMAVTGGSSGGGMWGSLFSAVGGMITGSANGNIMSPYGPLKLNKYANGGIATSPQLSVFGEGDRNEAYVPLPDNRTIPVTLSGNTGGQVSIGDTTINVTVDSSGSAETTIEGNAQMAKMLGQAIKKTVQEEFINQARPGGMLYGR